MGGVLSIAGNVIIVIGLVFMAFGVVAMFRFDNFYSRVLAASKVDTVGITTIVIGMVLRHGISSFSGKMVLIGVILLIFNPLVAHVLARSAYLSGYPLDDPDHDKCEVDK